MPQIKKTLVTLDTLTVTEVHALCLRDERVTGRLATCMVIQANAPWSGAVSNKLLPEFRETCVRLQVSGLVLWLQS